MSPKTCSVRGRAVTVHIETIQGLYADDEISIAPGPIGRMREVALHEVMHAAIARAGLECRFRSIEDEEVVVDRLARVLSRAMRRSRLEHKGRLLLPRYTT